jgi:hypothetical protein
VAFDTTELLASIRQRGMLAGATADGTADADLLRVATEELRSSLVPQILALREEMFVKSSAQSLVSAQRAYRIPTRAAGGKLNRVYLLDADGRERLLVHIEPSLQAAFPLSGTPSAFYAEGNSIVLVPTPGPGDTALRLGTSYYLRPSQLVATSAAGQITAVNAGAGTVDVSSSAWITFSTSQRFDFVRAGDGEPLDLDVAASSFTPGPNRFLFSPASLVPSGLQVGDYISFAGQSPVPYLPEDLLPWLAQAAAVKLLESLNDSEGLIAAREQLTRLEQNAVTLLNPRVDSEPRIFSDNTLLDSLD